jgi:hypothetical protein
MEMIYGRPTPLAQFHNHPKPNQRHSQDTWRASMRETIIDESNNLRAVLVGDWCEGLGHKGRWGREIPWAAQIILPVQSIRVHGGE